MAPVFFQFKRNNEIDSFLEIFENKIKSNSNVNKELGIVIMYQKIIYWAIIVYFILK